MSHSVDSPAAPDGGPALAEQPGQDEPGSVDAEHIADLIRRLLVALGENPDREGLIDTPRRVAAWYREFLSPGSPSVTCFTEAPLNGQMTIVGGMSVWTLCEHHLLPMNLQVAVGYVPSGEVVGLSKFARITQWYAARLQVQERFTRQVAEAIAQVIGSQNVGVAVCGTHLCMSMRGVRMEAARTITLQAGGRFQTDPFLAQQFLTLATRQVPTQATTQERTTG